MTGLSYELRAQLIVYDTEDIDLLALIKTCQKVDNRLRAAHSLAHGRTRLNATANARATSSSFPASPASALTPNSDGTVPMDLLTARPKRGPLTIEERECRFKDGLCLYCGKSGYIASSCPNRPTMTRPTMTVRSASV